MNLNAKELANLAALAKMDSSDSVRDARVARDGADIGWILCEIHQSRQGTRGLRIRTFRLSPTGRVWEDRHSGWSSEPVWEEVVLDPERGVVPVSAGSPTGRPAREPGVI